MAQTQNGADDWTHSLSLSLIHISSVSEHIADGQEFGYPDVARLVAEAADKMNITDKRVLVIGTEVPWLETVLLQRKPR